MTPNRSTRRRESHEIEWTGNPLAKGGTRAKIGDLEAELMRVAPDYFGPIQRPLGGVNRIGRTWILNIFDTASLNIEGQCIASMLLTDHMAEGARREAEKILRWAASYAKAETSDAEQCPACESRDVENNFKGGLICHRCGCNW